MKIIKFQKLDLLLQFSNHIKLHHPELLDKELLIACSGGIDSMVLVHLAYQLKWKVNIAHCNFKLRGEESNKDQEFVNEIARKFHFPFHTINFETKAYAKKEKLSIQMAARELRYDWFAKVKNEFGFDYILTAHHLDDSLETFIINLSRGTGIEGLTGVPAENDYYIRPLLPFSREQIVSYAGEHQVLWREDSSNIDTKYLRNQIRHQVVPQLKLLHSDFLKNFNTTLTHLQTTKSFIDKQVARVKKDVFEYALTGEIKIPIAKLEKYNDSSTFLFFLLKSYGFSAWDDIASLLTAQSGKQIFSKEYRIIKDRENLLLTRIKTFSESKIYHIPEDEHMLMLTFGTLKFKLVPAMSTTDLQTIYVDKKKLNYPLTVRKWKEGDYFYPLGMKGKKKLSKFFKDEKLSLLAKERVWVLCSGDDIVWIINYRADNRFKITPDTQNILKILCTT